MQNNNDPLSPSQILLPVAIVSLTLFLSLGFQGVQIMRDRDSLHQFITSQDQPLDNTKKIETQLSALALGTKKLADSGDKSAAAIIARLSQLGIAVGNPPDAGAPAPAPAAPAAP